jgi:hypothetical protein
MFNWNTVELGMRAEYKCMGPSLCIAGPICQDDVKPAAELAFLRSFFFI